MRARRPPASVTSGDRCDVLFLLRSPAYVRNFESVLRLLAERGHVTTVLLEEPKAGGDQAGLALIERLCSEHSALSWELLAARPLGVRGRLRMALAAGQDYLRYFDGPLGEATRLRPRALEPVPGPVERAIARMLRALPRTRRVLASTARHIDSRLGVDHDTVRELERRGPGVLLVSPLVHFRSRQADWVSAGRVLGIRTMLCLHSWDNLTTKGLMHAHPDRIAVWNESQRRQVIDLHRGAAGSIVVTGAWPYDHWFGWAPSRTREELVRELGLPEERALILYVCSSRFIADRELPAVVRWVSALRSSADPRLATANVIVRPHPLNGNEWRDRSPRDLPGVVVFPVGGEEPVDDRSRSDYFDSIAHADAVVGVNTSALLESAIIDRPALALPEPEFRSSQRELPHFHELAGDEGILRVAGSMPEHIEQLSACLADPAGGATRRRRFVETFLRSGDGPQTPSESVAAVVEELLGSTRRAPTGAAATS